jgi:hypothetical protein
MSYYDDEQRDYGFDQPDQREEWILKDGSRLELWIVRSYFRDPEDPEMTDYKVAFKLVKFAEDERGKGTLIIQFPYGKDEGTCSEVVALLYADEIDDEETDEARDHERERQHQIRMGY